MSRIGSDERRPMRKRMGRNRNIEVFETPASLLEPCFKATKVRADVSVQSARGSCTSRLSIAGARA